MVDINIVAAKEKLQLKGFLDLAVSPDLDLFSEIEKLKYRATNTAIPIINLTDGFKLSLSLLITILFDHRSPNLLFDLENNRTNPSTGNKIFARPLFKKLFA